MPPCGLCGGGLWLKWLREPAETAETFPPLSWSGWKGLETSLGASVGGFWGGGMRPADALQILAGAETGEQLPDGYAVGRHGPRGGDLGQGLEHEAALPEAGMGESQLRGVRGAVAVEEDVDVQGA